MVLVGKEHVEETSEHLPGPYKYIHNHIVNPFRVVILHYAEHIREIHGLTKDLPPPSMKCG